jgi:hypothetical protein
MSRGQEPNAAWSPFPAILLRTRPVTALPPRPLAKGFRWTLEGLASGITSPKARCSSPMNYLSASLGGHSPAAISLGLDDHRRFYIGREEGVVDARTQGRSASGHHRMQRGPMASPMLACISASRGSYPASRIDASTCGRLVRLKGACRSLGLSQWLPGRSMSRG